MANPFHSNARLPVDVEEGAHGGCGFKTSVISMSSGEEQRNVDWQEARGRWEVGYGISDKDTYSEFQAFFRARRGKAYGFLFKDWSDFELVAELIGVGDASETDFQVIKTYEPSGDLPYVRRITRPILATLKVYLDGVLKTLMTHYTVTAAGLITFLSAPGMGVNVTVDCDFDVPVRFDTDTFDLVLDWEDAGVVSPMGIVELRE